MGYYGFASTLGIVGNDATRKILLTLENGPSSYVDVYIRRLNVQCDKVNALTTVIPIARSGRVTGAVSGGLILPKGVIDSQFVSDASVVLRSGENPISGSPSTTAWQQYTSRPHTAVEQIRSDDNNLLPMLVQNAASPFVLHPGETLMTWVDGSAATSNPFAGTNWFVDVAWEEVALSTFAISGTVTLSAVPVTGALVTVIESDDEVGTNAFLREIITTPAGGTWASTIRTGKVGAAFVQYKSGGTYYTAPGSPFLQ